MRRRNADAQRRRRPGDVRPPQPASLGYEAHEGVDLADPDALRACPATHPCTWHPPPAPGYEVVVITNRRWLRDLPRHQREARRTLGPGGSPLSRIMTRRDNVVIVYPAGAPKNLARLKRILDDL